MSNEVIEVKDLRKTYRDVTALKGVSFTVKKGEIVGVLGPNGSGKTTIIKSILGLIEYDGGEILVNGQSNKQELAAALSGMGAVLEGDRNIYLYLSPEENMNYFAGIRGMSSRLVKERREWILKTLGLNEVRNKPVQFFSRGMRQKAAIASALIHDPGILLLDEPTLGLDVETARTMREWLKEIAGSEKKTILITSHDMRFVESVCERVLIIREGKIISAETIEGLRQLFSGKLYAIEMSGHLTPAQEKELQQIGPLVISDHQGRHQVKLTVTDHMKVFEIMETLKKGKAEIRDLAVKEKDLEEIFLSIIKGKEES